METIQEDNFEKIFEGKKFLLILLPKKLLNDENKIFLNSPKRNVELSNDKKNKFKYYESEEEDENGESVITFNEYSVFYFSISQNSKLKLRFNSHEKIFDIDLNDFENHNFFELKIKNEDFLNGNSEQKFKICEDESLIQSAKNYILYLKNKRDMDFIQNGMLKFIQSRLKNLLGNDNNDDFLQLLENPIIQALNSTKFLNMQIQILDAFKSHKNETAVKIANEIFEEFLKALIVILKEFQNMQARTRTAEQMWQEEVRRKISELSEETAKRMADAMRNGNQKEAEKIFDDAFDQMISFLIPPHLKKIASKEISEEMEKYNKWLKLAIFATVLNFLLALMWGILTFALSCIPILIGGISFGFFALGIICGCTAIICIKILMNWNKKSSKYLEEKSLIPEDNGSYVRNYVEQKDVPYSQRTLPYMEVDN